MVSDINLDESKVLKKVVKKPSFSKNSANLQWACAVSNVSEMTEGAGGRVGEETVEEEHDITFRTLSVFGHTFRKRFSCPL